LTEQSQQKELIELSEKNKSLKQANNVLGIIAVICITLAFISMIASMGIIDLGVSNESNNIKTSEENMVIVQDTNITELDKLALKLSNDGWVIYGSQACSYCDKQKDEFGKSLPYLNYVDCSTYGRPEFVDAYPMWYNYKTQETKMGYQTIDELKEW
jgi:hypothetical protein